MKKISLFLSICIIITVFNHTNIIKSTTNESPLIDVTVDEYYSNSNYGGDTTLEIGNWDGNKRRMIYMQFDLSSYTVISRARLFIKASSVRTTTEIHLHAVSDSSWTEYEITWNTKPSFSPSIEDVQTTIEANQWLVFNLTSLSQLNIGSKFSIVLISNSGGDEVVDSYFYSKEASNQDNRPYLQIDTDPTEIIPEITPEKDRTIVYEITGNTISWNVGDNNPSIYNITQNGVGIANGTWTNYVPISVSIDGLELGVYTIVLYVNDTDGNSASDSISISVVESARLNPTADVTLDEYNPNSNYGGDTTLEIGNWDGNKRRWIFFKFDLSLINSVEESYFFIKTSSVRISTDIRIFEIGDISWSEYLINWNNKPAYTPTELSSSLTRYGSEWIKFNLTSFVKTHLGEVISFILISNSGGDEVVDSYFYSKEASNQDNRPYLDMKLDSSTILPEIVSLKDKTIFYGTTDNKLEWSVADNNPNYYTVTRNNSLIENKTWNENIITINIDNLDIGTYIYNLTIFDQDLNSISDVVNLKVTIGKNLNLFPTKDVTVDEYYPNSNYGGDTTLELGNWDGDKRRIIYFEFDLGITDEISSAMFHIYASSIRSTTEVQLFHFSGPSWNEFTVTWNNRPTLSSFIGSELVITGGQWLVFDISDIARTGPDRILNFALVSNSAGDNVIDVYFRSKEITNQDERPHINMTASGTYGPEIILQSPINTTYTSQDVWLNYIVNTTYSWVKYRLDGVNNVTISQNTLLQSLSEGAHHLIIYTSDIFGNEDSFNVYFSIDIPPSIHILSPIMTAYNRADIWLNFTSDESLSWIGYSLDNSPNQTITGNVLLQSLSEGQHTITIYANDTGGNFDSKSVIFTVDTISPEITLIRPGNATYISDIVQVEFHVTESFNWVKYSLSGGLNVTILNNITLMDLVSGNYSIILYTQDFSGNEASSEIIWFEINTPPNISVTNLLEYYTSDSLWINYTINEPVLWTGYSFDGNSNITISTNILLTGLSEGSHSIILYATDMGGVTGKSIIQFFEIDTIYPVITVNSPENKTYDTNQVLIDVFISEPTSWIGYSIDGQNYISYLDNSLITLLTEGHHSIVVSAVDIAGNNASSPNIWFTIDIPDTQAPLITLTNMNDHDVVSGIKDIEGEVQDDSPISFVSVTINNSEQFLFYIFPQNLTLTNISAGHWKYSFSFDSTLFFDGEYELTIETIDVFGNKNIESIRIIIDNISDTSGSTTSSTVPSSYSTTPTTSINTQSSDGFTLGFLLLAIGLTILIKKRK
ncbi:MAG: hypothetical protein HeimC3_30100 [Candidatus Heimdallarchaeota archaeon LC_3]|nr:MAG: hypothetical protein HeimC3_30100 [Candidatus Heimdallarchaeota archaeon LC_3]